MSQYSSRVGSQVAKCRKVTSQRVVEIEIISEVSHDITYTGSPCVA